MKTLRMIGMALMAVLICVNFASCSKDDEDEKFIPDGGGGSISVVTNFIRYQTTDGNVIHFDNEDFGDAEIVSNTYSNGYGIIEFASDVTEIGKSAFYYGETLTSIAIPKSITSIGISAFDNCYNLKEVHISDLAAWCNIDFEYYSSSPLCYAENLYLNGELVKDLIIPEGVENIKDYAFYECSGLTSVTIPNSVKSIGDYAFYECTGLTSVAIGDSVTYIGEMAFYDCKSLKTVTIPNSVTSIEYAAFQNCVSLKNVTIGNSVTSIGESAFSDCESLTSVTIGNSVMSIGKNVFSNCESLTNVTIGNSVMSIGMLAFSDCESLKTVTIPNSVTSIGENAFLGCSSLGSITIPNSVTYIGETAFCGCPSLRSIVVEDGNTKYDSRCNCNAIIETATNILIFASNNSMIPNDVVGIEYMAFYNMENLRTINIPNSVTSIGEWAFSHCSSLTSVVIGSGVTYIGNSPFNGCKSLEELYVKGRIPATLEYGLGCEDATLYVPKGSLAAYKAANGWKKFKNIVEFDPTSI